MNTRGVDSFVFALLNCHYYITKNIGQNMKHNFCGSDGTFIKNQSLFNKLHEGKVAGNTYFLNVYYDL